MSEDAVIPDKILCRMIDFNFFPSLEMDDSWWESDWLATPLFARIRNIKATRRKLSDFILESYRLEHENYFDFESYERQAALLSRADLKSLLYAMGLIIESDTIASAIEKETQQAIKRSLGEADYLYALKNRMSMNRTQSKHKIPLADKKVRDAADFKDCIYQSGLRCLLSLLDDMPQGFIQRILFKLPKAWGTAPSGNKDDYRAIRTCLPRLFKDLKIS